MLRCVSMIANAAIDQVVEDQINSETKKEMQEFVSTDKKP